VEALGRNASSSRAVSAPSIIEGEEVLRPLTGEIGPPAVDLLDRMPYTAFQAGVDPLPPRGWLNYHRGEHLAGCRTKRSTATSSTARGSRAR
jgi:hypothetical protein